MDQGHVQTVLNHKFRSCSSQLHVQRRRPHYLRRYKPRQTTRNLTAHLHTLSSSTSMVLLSITRIRISYKEVERLDRNSSRYLSAAPRSSVDRHRLSRCRTVDNADLLADKCSETNDFRRGIYWCLFAKEYCSPECQRLATSLGGNMQLVEIRGFDEVMEELASLPALSTNTRPVSLPVALDGSKSRLT